MWDYLPQKAGGAKTLEEFAMALAANSLKVGVSQLKRRFASEIFLNNFCTKTPIYLKHNRTQENTISLKLI